MRGFLPLPSDGIVPRQAFGGELVMQTNEHTNPCLIKQSVMLTFTQRGLPHVSAVTMAGGSLGESKTETKRSQGPAVSPAAPLQQCLSMEGGERERREGVKRG